MAVTGKLVLVASLLLAAQPGAVRAQGEPPMTVVVAPFYSSAALNLAVELTDGVRAGVDSISTFDQIDWAEMLDSSTLTRDMTAEERGELGCLQGRQLVHYEGIDAVLCGSVTTTPDGLLLEFSLHSASIPDGVRFEPLVSTEAGPLLDHALGELRAWASRGAVSGRNRHESWDDRTLRGPPTEGRRGRH